MTPLEIVVSVQDEASDVFQQIAENLGPLADAFAAVGAAAIAAGGAVAVATMDTQVAMTRLSTTTQDSIDNADAAAKGQGTLGDMLAYAATQAALAKDSLDKLTASKKSNIDQIDAAQMKYDLDAAKLQVLQARMDDAGRSAADLAEGQQKAIDAGVNLGFTVDETANALNVLQPIMGSKLAESALVAAENMTRMSNGTLDLASASRMLGQAMETGMGRGLAQFGIVVKDGVGGTDLLTAAMEASRGQAQAYADTLSGSLAVAWAHINQDMSDMGNAHMPILTKAVNEFTFVALPALLSAFNNLIPTIQHMATQVYDFLDNLGLIDLWRYAWDNIVTTFQTNLLPALERLWAALQPLMPFLKALGEVIGVSVYGAVVLITDALTITINIFTTLLTIVTNVTTYFATYFINTINGSIVAISSLIDWVKQAVDWLGKLNVAQAAGGVASAIGGAISNVGHAIIPGATQVHDAIITPSGQVIQTDPADYLFATKTPGSLGGGGGSVTINILGGNYLDSTGARTIAAAVGDEIIRRLRLNQRVSI